MSAELTAVALLNERFLKDYPFEAARALEVLGVEAAVAAMRSRSPTARLRTWQALAPDRAADVLLGLPAEMAQQLLVESEPQVGVAALAYVDAVRRDTWLATLPAEATTDLRALMQHRPDTAGQMMDPRIAALGVNLTVAEAIERLRSLRSRGQRELFVVDDQMQLVGQIEVEDLALTGRERPLREITHAVMAVVRDTDTVAVVTKKWQEQPLGALPVVSESGRLLGVVRQSQLLAAAQRARGIWGRWFRR